MPFVPFSPQGFPIMSKKSDDKQSASERIETPKSPSDHPTVFHEDEGLLQEVRASAEKKLVRKLDLRLLPTVAVIFLMNYIDVSGFMLFLIIAILLNHYKFIANSYHDCSIGRDGTGPEVNESSVTFDILVQICWQTLLQTFNITQLSRFYMRLMSRRRFLPIWYDYTSNIDAVSYLYIQILNRISRSVL